MIPAVLDTSSLLSLEMINVLKKSLKIMNIIIPEAVFEEIKEIGKYEDGEGKAAKKILLFKDIKVVKVKNMKKADELLSKNVNRSEAECFICCIEQNIKTLIMDDVNAAYRLEGLAILNDIKMKISVAVVVELYKEKILDREELKNSINNLIEIRGWEGGVLEPLAKNIWKT